MDQLMYMAKKVIVFLLVAGLIFYYVTNTTHANDIIGGFFGWLGSLYHNIIEVPLNSVKVRK